MFTKVTLSSLMAKYVGAVTVTLLVRLVPEIVYVRIEPSLPRMEDNPMRELVERVNTGSRTVRTRVWESLPRLLLAVTKTLYVPVAVGVPVMVPPEFVNPGGKPDIP